MTFLTIAQRELRAAAHRRGTYRLRWGVALGAAGAAGLVLVFGTSRDSGTFLFGFIGFGCLVLAGVSGLFLTSDAIAAERRDGTLGLLYLTELGPFDVLLGKLVALGINAVCALLAVFPVLSLSWLLGGLTGAEVMRLLLVGLQVLFVSLCAGLGVSAWGQRQGAVVGGTAALLGLFLAWPWVVGSLPVPGANHWAALSPLLGVTEALEMAYRTHEFWWHLALGQLSGWVLLGVAAIGLKRRWQGGEETAEGPSVQRRRPRQISTELRPDELPVKAVQHLLSASPWPRRMAWWCVVIVVLITTSVGIVIGKDAGASTYAISAFVAGLLCKGLFAWQSVGLLAEAGRTGSLELLLCTPVSDREIRRAHTESLKATFLWPLLTLYVLDWIAASLVIPWGDQGGGPYGVFLTISLVGMGITALQCWAMMLGGLWWGLNETRPTVAFAKNYLLSSILCLPLMYFCLIGLAVPLILIAWLTAKLRRPLRVILTDRDTAGPR